MNDVNIQQFIKITEEYLKANRNKLSDREIDHVAELYDDLVSELSSQQLFEELYH